MRHERFRGRDFERDERTRSGPHRGRFGRQESYTPDWDDPNAARGFEGDRSYRAGYEQHPGRGEHSSRDFRRDDYRAEEYGSEGRWGREPWRERDENWRSRDDADEQGGWYSGSAEPGEPWRARGRGVGLMRWDDRSENTGDYFGTGSYYGAYATQPGSRASGSAYGDRGYLGANEDRWGELRENQGENRSNWYGGSSGSYETYGRSDYGAQAGYGRNYGQRFGNDSGYGQNYRERFGEQRYGRNPEFGYGFAREGTQGTFRGRGPKGYERSDERLREMICERLTDDPRIDASEVHVEVQDKIVKLTGFVSDRRSKYEIEDVVEHCGGVKDIDNQVRVHTSGMTQSSGSRIASNEGAESGASQGTESRSGTRGASSGKRTS